MKIKISADYDSSENLTERLLLQFKTDEIDLSGLEFVYDESYDVIVFFNYINNKIVEGKDSFVFPHEPSWNGSHQKFFEKNVTVFGFDCGLYHGGGNCIESVAHTFYGGRGPWIDKLDFWCYDNLVNSKFPKSKVVSSSITRLDGDFGETCLYRRRVNVLNFLREKKVVDLYDGHDKPLRKDALVDYMFNFSIENSIEKNWITEKFYDNVLTDTIPIYFGCKNIKDIYPEDGYILINDIEDLDEISFILDEIIRDPIKIYNSKIQGLNEIKKRYFNEFNLLKQIKNIVWNRK